MLLAGMHAPVRRSSMQTMHALLTCSSCYVVTSSKRFGNRWHDGSHYLQVWLDVFILTCNVHGIRTGTMGLYIYIMYSALWFGGVARLGFRSRLFLTVFPVGSARVL